MIREQELKMLQTKDESIGPIILKIQQEIKEYDILPERIRDSHINKQKRLIGDSVFTYREPTIIRENRTLIGGTSVFPRQNNAKGQNSKTQTSRGFCSIFGGFGGEAKKTSKDDKGKK